MSILSWEKARPSRFICPRFICQGINAAVMEECARPRARPRAQQVCKSYGTVMKSDTLGAFGACCARGRAHSEALLGSRYLIDLSAKTGRWCCTFQKTRIVSN